MKMDLSQNDFIDICKLVNNHVNQQPSHENEHKSIMEGSETTEVNSSNKNPLQENPTSLQDDDIVRTNRKLLELGDKELLR